MSDYISWWQPTGLCNSFVPSLCSSALLGEQSVSAALGISSVAGSGCVCRSKFPVSPAVLIFKGKWGRRLQSYVDRSGYGDFTKKWLCNGWGLGLKKQGAHGVTLPCALNCLFQKLSFLVGSSCRPCRLCTEPSKFHWAAKDKLCCFSLVRNIKSEQYKFSLGSSLVACASWVSLAVHLGLVRNQTTPGAEGPPVLTLPFLLRAQWGEHGALSPSVLLKMKISPAFCWRLSCVLQRVQEL